MLRNILNTFSAKFFVALLNFVTVIITANLLGASIRGDIGLLVLAITIISLLSGIVGGAALVYLIPKTGVRPLLLPATMWAIFATGLVAILLFYFDLLGKTSLTGLLLLGVMGALKQANLIFLLGKKKITQMNIVNVLYAITMLVWIGFEVFLLEQKDFRVYLNSIYLSSILALLLSYRYVFNIADGKTWWLSKAQFFVLFRNGIFNQVANLAHVLTNRINFYLLGSTVLVGIYSTGVSVTESLLLFSGSTGAILLAEVAGEKSLARSQRLTLALAKTNLGVCFIGWVALALLPKAFYQWVFGPEFGPIREVLLYLGPGILAIGYKAQLTHYFSGRGKHHINMYSTLVSLSITVILALSLIPELALKGAAIAASIGYISALLMLLLSFKKEAEIKRSFLIPDQEEITLVKNKIKQKLMAKNDLSKQR